MGPHEATAQPLRVSIIASRSARRRGLSLDPARQPTGNLDSVNCPAVMPMRELHRGGATICMVTHDPRYAKHADRTIHLFDGRVVEDEDERKARMDEAKLKESGFEVH